MASDDASPPNPTSLAPTTERTRRPERRCATTPSPASPTHLAGASRALTAARRSPRDGSYAFDTVVPGPYGERARHIHFLVHAEGYEPFITQSYLAGDPRLKTDRIARARNVVHARPAEVRGRRGRRGRFDLALR